MSEICSHTDSITVTELPEEIASCADCLAIGGTPAASFHRLVLATQEPGSVTGHITCPAFLRSAAYAMAR
jgi:hypothetical protein